MGRAQTLAGGLLLLMLIGCAYELPCEDPNAGATVPSAVSDEAYVSGADPYATGGLTVRTIRIGRCEDGAPVPMLVHTPERVGTYAVVVFQHGFISRNEWYDDVLCHVASHGFVVVAPQMYEPGLPALLGFPTAAEEADWAMQVLDWLPNHLSGVAGVTADTNRLGLAGHSRGGKVAWLMLSREAACAGAIAGLDPTDGSGSPFGFEPRVTGGSFDYEVPSLVIGTGRGGWCSPEGANHEQFYAASPTPAWHVVLTEAGHADIYDEPADAASIVALVCPSGRDREVTRLTTAALLTAFFRGVLLHDEGALFFLISRESSPMDVEVEWK